MTKTKKIINPKFIIIENFRFFPCCSVCLMHKLIIISEIIIFFKIDKPEEVLLSFKVKKGRAATTEEQKTILFMK